MVLIWFHKVALRLFRHQADRGENWRGRARNAKDVRRSSRRSVVWACRGCPRRVGWGDGFCLARARACRTGNWTSPGPRYGLPHSGCTARSGRMMFPAGWLLHSIPLAAALGLALMAMQAPAVTHEYQTALLQLVRSSEQEIAQRKASTRSTTRRLCRPRGRRFRNRHLYAEPKVRIRLPPPMSLFAD